MIDRNIEVYIGKLDTFLKQQQKDFPDFRTLMIIKSSK